MKMNASKTKSFIVSRSRTNYPPHPTIYINDTPIADTKSMKFLGINFDSKLSFEEHIRSISSMAASKLGIIRKAARVYSDPSINLTCFRSFVLPLLEYGSPVWAGASDCHLKLLNKVHNQAKFLFPDNGNYDLEHRRKVSSLSLLHKIYNCIDHSLNSTLPTTVRINQDTRLSVSLHNHCLELAQTRTEQFSKSFIPKTIRLWNGLPSYVFDNPSANAFKSAVNRYLKLSD